jgi:hypothetical protein
MHATRLTFFRVARGAVPAEPWLRPGVEEISDFLVDHVDDLQKRASEGTAANATFPEAADRQLIEDIRIGDDAAFLSAAKKIGGRLIEAMGPLGTAKPGLLLCATFESEEVPSAATAAVLKLEVVSEHGAILELLESGEETLAAVQRVLDKPGELQKGLVYPDTRSDSEAIVGDKAAQQEARYFLRAVAVTLEAHAASSARELVRAVAAKAGPGVARSVVRALPSIEPASPAEVLGALRASVPELTEDTADEVARTLATADRPVVRVDTKAPVRGVVQAGPLRITGPAADIGRVEWTANPEGGWVVTFTSDQEPRRSYG